MEDQQASEQSAALLYIKLRRGRNWQHSGKYAQNMFSPSRLFFPAPLFFYLSGDSCFLCVFVSGRCTGLLSVVSTGACACPTIHLCPLGWVLSQLSFSLHSSVTVFFLSLMWSVCLPACFQSQNCSSVRKRSLLFNLFLHKLARANVNLSR